MPEHQSETGGGHSAAFEMPRPVTDTIDLVEESVVVFQLDMRLTAWNAAAERIYGWKREEVIGGLFQSAVHCSPSEPLNVILVKVQESGIWRGEFVRRTKAGGIVAVKAKWSLRRDAAGAAMDIVETSRDITEVHQTEEAFNQLQYQYQNLFQASVASFWELEFSEVRDMVLQILTPGDTDLVDYLRDNPSEVRRMIRATRIVDVNEQSLAMFGGGDRSALLGSLDRLWPDDSLAVFAGIVVAAFERKRHFSSEAVIFSVSGQRFDTMFTVSYPSQILDSARLLVGIVDITQAKAAKAAQEISERRYRDLFHLLPVPLMQINSQEALEIFDEARSKGVIDFQRYMVEQPEVTARLLDGMRIIEVNSRTVNMLRGESAEAFIGPMAQYWTRSPEVFREVMAAKYARRPGFEAMIKIPTHDGTILDVLFFQTFSSIAGEQHFSVVQLIDVSDRVKAEKTLARVQAEIAHAARVSVLGELTASIAHEVSQPLTAIEANTEASLIWLDGFQPNIKEVRELLARTAVEVQRAADIIHRIQTMAAGTAPEKKYVGLNAIVEEAILFLRHETQRHDVSIALDLNTSMSTVFGDRVQLQQVIVNLAVNAIQAMAFSNQPSRILGIKTAVNNSGVVIEVEDTGPGIAEAAFARLFESFFTTKATGMGIGLAISRSIIEEHGGNISVENRTDRSGARFLIRLPARGGKATFSSEKEQASLMTLQGAADPFENP